MRPHVYIYAYGELAVQQMVEHKIPASVTLAQAIFESNCGNSSLARRSNNHFGIKCHIEWGGDTIIKTDDTLNECFRSYKSVYDSYLDRSLFLKSRTRYTHLFNLNITDYKGWCYGLKNSGYATYTCYIDELLKIIESYNLHEFDGVENLSQLKYSAKTDEIIHTIPLKFDTLKLTSEAVDLFFSDEKDIPIQNFNLLADKYSFENAEISRN